MEHTILKYLADLKMNNNREWYLSHKHELIKANEEFEGIIEQLICEIGREDRMVLNHNPKDLTFKLVRDTRFSKDKSPYNPTFRCHIGPEGKLPIPVGYFISISPNGQSFLGGGLFTDMFTDATNSIRKYISLKGEEFNRIITAPVFSDLFDVKGTSLKNVPKEYDSKHPQAQFLKYKSWYVEKDVEDSIILDTEKFVQYATKVFLAMKPFNDFLNLALKDFKMPTRP